MNKTHLIIYIAVFLAMILPVQSCSDRGKQSGQGKAVRAAEIFRTVCSLLPLGAVRQSGC